MLNNYANILRKKLTVYEFTYDNLKFALEVNEETEELELWCDMLEEKFYISETSREIFIEAANLNETEAQKLTLDDMIEVFLETLLAGDLDVYIKNAVAKEYFMAAADLDDYKDIIAKSAAYLMMTTEVYPEEHLHFVDYFKEDTPFDEMIKEYKKCLYIDEN